MIRSRLTALLAISAVVAGILVGLPAAAMAAVPPPATCVNWNQQPPAPPTSPVPGFVIYSPPIPGRGPNLLIGYLGESFSDLANCSSLTLNHPQSIAVAPGAALVFKGFNAATNQKDALVAPWGGASTPTDVAIPQGMNPVGQAANWGGTSSVSAIDPADFTNQYMSCSNCNLTNMPLTGDPPQLQLLGGLPNVPDPSGWNSDGTVVANIGNFRGASLPPAVIAGNIEGYQFDGADFDAATVIAEASTTDFRGLRSAVGTRFNMQAVGSDWDGANLSGASFTPSGSIPVFVPANISKSSFNGVTLNATTFSGADITSSSFQLKPYHSPPSFAGAVLDNGEALADTCVSFSNSPLWGVSFANVSWVKTCVGPMFPGSALSLLALKQIVLDQKLAGVDFTGATIVASSADRSVLAGQDLTGADLAGFDVVGEPLDLTGTKLDGANLTGTNLSLSTLSGASLTNVSAAGASFEGANLTAVSANGTAANFSGANTNLQNADFTDADASGAQFIGANLSGAVFTGVRGRDTLFDGVRAVKADFSGAHLYGKGTAFDKATDLTGIDFSGAVLAADVNDSGGFDFAGADMPGANFDGAECVGCDFAGATLDGATFTGAYLPGVKLGGASLTQAAFNRAWLYCGSLSNALCAADGQQWQWPLALGSGESFGPVAFSATALPASMANVATCPDGKQGSLAPAGCAQINLLPKPAEQPVLPAPCTPSATGACPTPTSLVDSSAAPLAIAPSIPVRWNTELQTIGTYVSYADSTIRTVAENSPAVIDAGTPGKACPSPTSACGDGGPATQALLGRPSGLAVGLDGSVYVADSALRRVRKIAPNGVITTVAGNGKPCNATSCGDGQPATAAALAAANGVSVDVTGALLIADGKAGVRRVAPDGLLTTLAQGSATGNVVSVVSAADGTVYASDSVDSVIVAINPNTGTVTPVVGTGVAGYNGNSGGAFGFLLPGTQVQINHPAGLSIDRAGDVLFADTGNDLIRAYVPSTTNVIDVLAGTVVNGTPQGGYNGNGKAPDATELQAPLDVAATGSALLLVADTGNGQVRQVGPLSDSSDQSPSPSTPVLLVCKPGRQWKCARQTAPPDPKPKPKLGSVTITAGKTLYAQGEWLAPQHGKQRLLVTEAHALVPGSYVLTSVQGRHRRQITLRILAP
jgi:uncharacterized protein YjbI with pentapeptide repeats